MFYRCSVDEKKERNVTYGKMHWYFCCIEYALSKGKKIYRVNYKKLKDFYLVPVTGLLDGKPGGVRLSRWLPHGSNYNTYN